jgi:hypothetical protein
MEKLTKKTWAIKITPITMNAESSFLCDEDGVLRLFRTKKQAKEEVVVGLGVKFKPVSVLVTEL